MTRSKDRRPWLRLTVTFPDHPKIATLSDAAFRTLVEMLCWSRENLTDGIIPARLATRRWGYQKTQSVTDSVTQPQTDPVTELLTNDPENPSLTVIDTGDLAIHDYLEHQESRERVTGRKAQNTANGRKGGRPRKTQSVTDSVTQPQTKSPTETKSRVESREIKELNSSFMGGVGGGLSVEPATADPTETTAPRKRDAQKRGTRLPEDWTLPPDLLAWTHQTHPGIDPHAEAEKFRDYWTSTTGQRATKLDWPATWRNWIRNAAERTTTRPRTQNDILRANIAQAIAHDQTTTRALPPATLFPPPESPQP